MTWKLLSLLAIKCKHLADYWLQFCSECRTARASSSSLVNMAAALVPFTVLVLVFSLVSVITAGPAMADQEAERLSTGISTFSGKFYNEVAKRNPNQNLVMSPLSADIVLALLSLGTSGDTHEQILSALNLPSDEFTQSAFKSAITKLTSLKGVKFDVANKVYIKDGKQYILNSAFDQLSKDVFQAGLEKLDFSKNVEAANTINKWVESKTNNRIKDLLKADSLDANTRMVLVNALYFKGTWKTKFLEKRTAPKPFHVDATTTVTVPTMAINGDFKYTESQELDAKILEMPYEGDEVSMVIILPNKVDGLPALQEKLANGVDVRQALQNLYSSKVDVQLPKFKVETTIDLIPVLQSLGINDIFDTKKAKLDKLLTNSEDLYVSKAIQKAFIEVNEEGAEAAAATAFQVMLVSLPILPEPVPVFHADHPFTSLIVTRTRDILFVSSFSGN